MKVLCLGEEVLFRKMMVHWRGGKLPMGSHCVVFIPGQNGDEKYYAFQERSQRHLGCTEWWHAPKWKIDQVEEEVGLGSAVQHHANAWWSWAKQKEQTWRGEMPQEQQVPRSGEMFQEMHIFRLWFPILEAILPLLPVTKTDTVSWPDSKVLNLHWWMWCSLLAHIRQMAALGKEVLASPL